MISVVASEDLQVPSAHLVPSARSDHGDHAAHGVVTRRTTAPGTARARGLVDVPPPLVLSVYRVRSWVIIRLPGPPLSRAMMNPTMPMAQMMNTAM